MQARAIMLAISWASVSLTAGASRAALRHKQRSNRMPQRSRAGPQADEREVFSRSSMPAFRTRSPF